MNADLLYYHGGLRILSSWPWCGKRDHPSREKTQSNFQDDPQRAKGVTCWTATQRPEPVERGNRPDLFFSPLFMKYRKEAWTQKCHVTPQGLGIKVERR